MARSGTHRLWLGYLAAGVVMAVVRGLVPTESAPAGLIAGCYPLLAIAAIITGIRRHRPGRTLPWLLLLATIVLNMAGYAVLLFHLIRNGGLEFPSASDAFWLIAFPIEMTGMMMLITVLGGPRDRAGLLDTLMVTSGLGLGVWLLFLRAYIEPVMAPAARLVTIAYPLAVLLMASGLVRMCISSVRRSPAYWQLVGAVVLQGVGQAGYLVQTTYGIDPSKVAPAYVLATMLLGGAALHPSMATLGQEHVLPAAHVTRARVTLIGSACLMSPVLLIANGVLDHGRVDWLAASICCIVVFLLVMARILGLVRTVQEQGRQLESIAYLDGLTGIPNRRAWDAELDRRLAVARRTGGALVVGLIDLDHFKNYNDLLGHPAGDALLRDASKLWQQQLRTEDLIARYGGEEFGVILHCRLREASIVMERLREVTPEGQTFSAGLALWTGEESLEQLMSRVDAALYTAKREGRDQYTVTGHPARTDLQSDFLAAAETEPR